MDGEESTSKEVKRSAFEIDSMTEQRYTPHEKPSHSSNNRYPMKHQINVEASIDESSSPLESGGQANRPSAIETILNAGGKDSAAMNDDEDDDDYS